VDVGVSGPGSADVRWHGDRAVRGGRGESGRGLVVCGVGPGAAEMSAAKHDEFYALLHDNTGQAQSKVHANGDAAWKKERRAYWIERAKDFP
jgi:hypothetical protein